ncbi:MAG: hypothetical protein OEZ43_17735 [Gammaproteobacteria bacterium]|nr:hypothetical protein [Gammaproteobacteria bacterium]
MLPSTLERGWPELFAPILFVITTFFMSGCGVSTVGQSTVNIGNGQIVIEFPESLDRQLSESTDVVAKISVDDGKQPELSIDRKTKSNAYLRVCSNDGALGFQKLSADRPLLSVDSAAILDGAIGAKEMVVVSRIL